MILSCIQKRSLTILGRIRMGGESRRRVLYFSSSGVLYNSSSFFPLSLTRNAATTSTPRFRGPSPLGSTRFQPFATKSERAPASSRRQWVSSGIGNKLCSAELARKITGRPEIRARRAAAKKKSCWRSILLDEFFVCGSGNENGTGRTWRSFNSNLTLPEFL